MKIMKIFKQQLLIHLIGTCISSGAVVTFSDSIDVISVTPPAPFPFTLDSAPYGNTILGGPWFVNVTVSSTIDNFEVSHSIFLFGSGSLDIVTVFGTAPGAVDLIASSGPHPEETFSGITGTLVNEYVFDLSGYSLNSGGSTLFTGFDSISTINFSGSYTSVPEPSASMLLITAMVSLTFRRMRFGYERNEVKRGRGRQIQKRTRSERSQSGFWKIEKNLSVLCTLTASKESETTKTEEQGRRRLRNDERSGYRA